MKKKILICFKNPVAIDNLFLEIASLSQKFDITILTTNHLLNDKNRKKYENFGLKYNIESFKFIPYFSKKPFSRSINSIIRTHVFLRKLKKKLILKNLIYAFQIINLIYGRELYLKILLIKIVFK